MKETEYKLIQIEDKYEFVIGEITMQKDKFIRAELFTTSITNSDDIHEIRSFLDVIEEKMKEK